MKKKKKYWVSLVKFNSLFMRCFSFGFTLIFKNEIMNNIIKNNQKDVGVSCKAIVLVSILPTLIS